MSFISIGAGAALLAKQAIMFETNKRLILDHIGPLVEKNVKDIIGQEDVQGSGGFASHDPLAPSTIEYKEAHGYTGRVSETDPLLRTGDLRDSIHHVVDYENDSVVIGSGSDVAVYQELGTSKIPPRSFIGIGAEHSKDDIKKFGIDVAISVFRNR